MDTLVSLFPVLVISLPCICVKEPQISLDTWHVSFRCCIVHADGRGSPWYRWNTFCSRLNTFYLRVHGRELVSFPCRAKGVAAVMLLTLMFVGSTKLRAEFQLLLLIHEQKLICLNTNLLHTATKCLPCCPRWVRVYNNRALGLQKSQQNFWNPSEGLC